MYFGLEWTDGVAYVDEETSEVNAFVINVYEMSSAWDFYMYHGYDGDFDDGATWTVDEENATWDCDAESGECEGFICATRALEQEGYFTLPFADGSEFRAIFDSTSFMGVVYSGAMSLGLALAATAGAALTLV